MIDGHIHSPYCPHGTSDTLESYVEQAIKSGYTSMTFTEHAPLPPSFNDPVPTRDSGMNPRLLEAYINDVSKVKKIYESDIEVKVGLEVDYISGFDEETKHFLNQYGRFLDDSILSVHFLPIKNNWYCIDYSSSVYKEAIAASGNINNLYQLYFDTLVQSVSADLGVYKPDRIGHMTLIKKFQQLYEPPAEWEQMATFFLDCAKEGSMTLDYNGAGINKEHCKEAYPPTNIARKASAKGIPLIYGSDAHNSFAITQGYHALDPSIIR
ncbi:histidinol-phosphatase HisJ [Halobacillus shinanisalinarum]|uniref:Histidinol-phosphatase n=1 Tax=Halobacillus shinanisalinarum TaxID=2932258 RepID=A0ABY4H1C8_9BACI|nr:histidinol-phosphatase HisJ [Halobacillus shinanisalinarum]UOQ94144.1 histidinol-phosphatase HisJ [Halobacillus shinanisalinarum]